MPTPRRKVTFLLPQIQYDRLTARAEARDEYLSDTIRRYIDAGDTRDTRAEQKTAAATGTDTP